MSDWIGKWLFGWITIVLAILTAWYPPFFAGIVSSSLQSNDLHTALIATGLFVLIWPMLILITVGSAQAFYRNVIRAR